jgi:thiamine-monophosphate kinase
MTEARINSEAELIALLAPLTDGAPGAFGLKDDCARLTPTAGYDLVLKTDPVRAGVHFFPDDPPEDIAWKALAVNVSDLAAKGAEPVAYLMALSFPEPPQRSWMQRFADGLKQAQETFGCTLIGGDTDRAPGPLSIAITAIGQVPTGQMVRRDTAKAGDAIYISGTLGDSGLGLRLHAEARDGRRDLRDRWGLTDWHCSILVNRYLRPQPRIELAGFIRQHASASMDISDGLVKDLERMCRASGVAAEVDSALIDFSVPAVHVLTREPAEFSNIISAGDDYEILAAVPQDQIGAVRSKNQHLPVKVHRIGTFTAGSGVIVKRIDGTIIPFDRTGWDHF